MPKEKDSLSAVYKHLESIGQICPEQATRVVDHFEDLILSKIAEKEDPQAIASQLLFLWAYGIVERAGLIYQGHLLEFKTKMVPKFGSQGVKQ